MLLLIAIGLFAGLVTSISPCVLPVLPVVLAAGSGRGGADGPRHRRSTSGSWRPYGVVAGLVVSFCASTLLGSLVLGAVGLPQDLLRDLGIAVLVLVGLGMVWPRLGDLVERPFVRLTGRPVNPDGNSLVVGLGAGLLFVPCAGPVLATIAVVGATHQVGVDAVVLTAAFGIGVGVPLLLLALAGDAIAHRVRALRRRARVLRVSSGVALIAVAAALALNLTDGLAQLVPGYTSAAQGGVGSDGATTQRLEALTTGPTGTAPLSATAPALAGAPSTAEVVPCEEGAIALADCGPAPPVAGIEEWLNTPGNQPVNLASLRGKVVLIDFWTYSCINCQRSLPHVEAWHQAYEKAGLVVIGVHSPEFAFEHVPANVAAQAAALGVHYPVAIDNDYRTWNAYKNRYWPAEYLIDASGTLRHFHYGEGTYDDTERMIRQLLTAARPGVALPAPTDLADTRTPTFFQTPETYLGYAYGQAVSGTTPVRDRYRTYRFPATVAPDTFALDGSWKAGPEALTAGPGGGRLRLSYQADTVHLVLGGTGSVRVEAGGVTTTVAVVGPPTLYTLVTGPDDSRAALTLTASEGVRAYDFTFG